MSLTKMQLMIDSLEQYLDALRQAVWEASHAANYSVGPVEEWPISVRLSCRYCDVKAVATLRLGDLAKMWQAIERQAFKCKCGGFMVDGPARIRLATVGALTNLS